MTEHLPPENLLGSTARWTAAVRAQESAREDRLIDDPWAAALAGPEGQTWIAQRPEASVTPILLRTRYFDDWLQRVAAGPQLRQVVLLGAGLDTRACRLDWPAGTVLFELDQAPVLQAKQAILDAAGAQPRCDRRVIGGDLTAPWAGPLVAAGFDPQQPAIWLLEGFLFYLPAAAVVALLDEVSRLAAPGSQLGFDIINSVMLTSPLTKAWVEMQARSGAPWIGTLDDPPAFLATRGWQAALTQAGQPDASYGRWPFPVLPTHMPNVPHNWFVTAEKTGRQDSRAQAGAV